MATLFALQYCVVVAMLQRYEQNIFVRHLCMSNNVRMATSYDFAPASKKASSPLDDKRIDRRLARWGTGRTKATLPALDPKQIVV